MAKSIGGSANSAAQRLDGFLRGAIRTWLRDKRLVGFLGRTLPVTLFARLVVWVATRNLVGGCDFVVVYFDRGLFARDVHELRKKDPRICWVGIPISHISIPQARHVPVEARLQNQYAQYDSDPGWHRCFKFAAALDDELAKSLGSRRVYLDANIDYWSTYSFRKLSSERKVPFYALSKEIPLTQAPQRLYETDYTGFLYGGTGIFCPSPWLTTFFESHLVRPGRVIASGLPRLDVYQNIARFPLSKDGIIWLTFLDGYGVVSKSRYFELLKSVLKIATSKNSVLTVKAKNQLDSSVHKNALGAELGSLLAVSTSRKLHEKFLDNRIVIGTNSLAVLEALLAPVFVVVPQFLTDPDEGLDFFSEGDDCPSIGMFVISSKELFEKTLQRLLEEGFTDFFDETVRDKRVNLVSRFINYSNLRPSSEAILSELRWAVGRS